jgi:DNA-binding Lrp family transcriptional regulator
MNHRETVLALLRKNARLRPGQIAERLDLNADEVISIISDAETSNTIRGYYAIIKDSAFTRHRVRALIEVRVNPSREGGFDPLARKLSKFAEVTDVILVSGDYDLLLTVEGDDLQQVADFVASKLATLDGVRGTRTHFMLKKYKEAGFLYEEDEDHERLKVTP